MKETEVYTDAYGRQCIQTTTCFVCGGSGIEYEEACLTCGGNGWICEEYIDNA